MGLIKIIQDHNRNVHLEDLKNIEREKYESKIQKEQPIENVICPNCKKTIPYDSNLCPYCTYDLRIVHNQSEQSDKTGVENIYCTGCGAKLTSDSNFCNKCGKKI